MSSFLWMADELQRSATKAGRNYVLCPHCKVNAAHATNRKRRSMLVFREGTRINWRCMNCAAHGAHDTQWETKHERTFKKTSGAAGSAKHRRGAGKSARVVYRNKYGF